MNHLPPGTVAPDFEMKMLDGGKVSLFEALNNGPVLLIFYKESCPTCQLTLPFIQRLYHVAGINRKMSFWAISQDEVEETRRFIGENGLEFPVLRDEHPYPLSLRYELRFVPTFYIVDESRVIDMADFGFSKPTLNAIAERLQVENDGTLFGPDYKELPSYRPG